MRSTDGPGPSLWPGLLLILAALLIAPWSIPLEHGSALAAWLTPVLLLLIARGFPAPVGLTIAGAILILATAIASDGFVTGDTRVLFTLIFGLVQLVPYVVDALLAPRLSPTLRTLPFPLALTAIDALLARSSPLATWGSPAYAHVDELVLAQLAALTGMAGITFFVGWTAAITVDALGSLRRRRLPRVVPAWAVVAAAIAVYGSVRLATAPPAAATIRVAGVTADDPGLAPPLPQARIAQMSPAERAALRPQFAPALARLEQRTWREADAGAQIVVWNEEAGRTLVEDEPSLLARAAALAQSAHVELLASYVVFLRSARMPFAENRTALFSPTGKRLFDDSKAHPVPGNPYDAAVPSGAPVPVVDTPLGRVATVICYDADFPSFVAQAGRAQADVLLDPALDWPGIRTIHSQMARLRAIEEGTSLFRITAHAQSLASDAYGRIVATANDDASDGTMVAMLPVGRAFVLAPWTTDLIAPLALAALAIIAIIAAVGVRGRAVRSSSG
jgi:apolipoprotein N-acyltransferase